MMKHKSWLMLIITSMGVVLAGCASTSGTINLMQVPQPESTMQDKMKKALDKILPPGSEYVTSKKSDQKKSIFIEDINKDGKQEAVVLYMDMKENRQVHLLTLNEVDGTWNKASDVATGDNYLDHFSIEDLNNDGKKEVIIGTSISDSGSKEFRYIWMGRKRINKESGPWLWRGRYSWL